MSNVIAGVVRGQIPYLQEHIDQKRSIYERYKEGFKDLAQVKGRNAITWEEKLDWDLKYIENVSFLGDIKILFETIAAVFKKDGITDGENATALDYGDALLKAGMISKAEYDDRQKEAKKLLEEHK